MLNYLKALRGLVGLFIGLIQLCAPVVNGQQRNNDEKPLAVGLVSKALDNQASSLNRFIREQVLTHQSLSSLNHEILSDVVRQLSHGKAQSSSSDIAEKQKLIFESSLVLALAVHSTAWLSPSYPDSAIARRGLLQSNEMFASYERENFQDVALEKRLGQLFLGIDGAAIRRSTHSILSYFIENFDSTFIVRSKNSSYRRWFETTNTLRKDLNNLDFCPSAARPIAADELKTALLIVEVESSCLEHILKTSLDRVFTAPAKSAVLLLSSGSGQSSKRLRRMDLLESKVPVYGLSGLNDIPETLGRFSGNTIGIFGPLNSAAIRDRHSSGALALKALGGNLSALSAWVLDAYFGLYRNWNFASASPLKSREGTLVTLDLEERLAIQDKVVKVSQLSTGRSDFGPTLLKYRELILKNLKTWAGARAPLDVQSSRVLLRHLAYLLTLMRSSAPAPRALYEHSLLSITFESCVPQPSHALLFSSGMAALQGVLKAIDTLSPSDVSAPGFLIANDSYYETEDLISKTRRLPGILRRFSQSAPTDLVELLKLNLFGNILIEPITNSLRRPRELVVDAGGHDQSDLRVTDLPSLLAALPQSSRPINIIVDHTASATDFRLVDKGSSSQIPQSTCVVFVTSLQKLYQRGLELTTGGAVIVMCGDSTRQKQLEESLVLMRDYLGLSPTSAEYSLLEIGVPSSQAIQSRTRRIADITSRAAQHLEKSCTKLSADMEVIHPSLASHPDHDLWTRMEKPAVPFLFIRSTKEVHQKFLVEFNRSLLSTGLGGLVLRDSFGFNDVSATYYFRNTDAEAIRISLGDMGAGELSRLESAIEQTCLRLRG